MPEPLFINTVNSVATTEDSILPSNSRLLIRNSDHGGAGIKFLHAHTIRNVPLLFLLWDSNP